MGHIAVQVVQPQRNEAQNAWGIEHDLLDLAGTAAASAANLPHSVVQTASLHSIRTRLHQLIRHSTDEVDNVEKRAPTGHKLRLGESTSAMSIGHALRPLLHATLAFTCK